MEDVTTITQDAPAALQPIPQVTLVRCPGHKGLCVHNFMPGSGFVPDVPTAYEQARGTVVNTDYPLTRSEILSLELCYTCSHDRLFEKYGIRMHRTAGTVELMERWAVNSLRAKERQKREQEHQHELANQRALAYALRKPDDKGFVNETLAHAKPHREKHKRGKRTATLRRYTSKAKPEQPKKEKNKKKSGGDHKRGKAR